MVTGKLTSPSSKIRLAKEEGGGSTN